MSFQPLSAPQRTYRDIDHDTWRRLCERQMGLVKDVAPTMYWEGFDRLKLDLQRLPVQTDMSTHLNGLVGWQLANAQDEYLKPVDWFIHLGQHHFPVTDYIRVPEDIEFTPLPDLFHEYFGHLAWMTLPRYNEVVNRFSRKYLASNEEDRLIVSNLWWFTIEFGMIREGGKVRPFGAGLLSSPGEFLYSQNRTHLHRPFTVEAAAKATAKPYAFHDEYFVLDGFEHLEEVTKDW